MIIEVGTLVFLFVIVLIVSLNCVLFPDPVLFTFTGVVRRGALDGGLWDGCESCGFVECKQYNCCGGRVAGPGPVRSPPPPPVIAKPRKVCKRPSPCESLCSNTRLDCNVCERPAKSHYRQAVLSHSGPRNAALARANSDLSSLELTALACTPSALGQMVPAPGAPELLVRDPSAAGSGGAIAAGVAARHAIAVASAATRGGPSTGGAGGGVGAAAGRPALLAAALPLNANEHAQRLALQGFGPTFHGVEEVAKYVSSRQRAAGGPLHASHAARRSLCIGIGYHHLGRLSAAEREEFASPFRKHAGGGGGGGVGGSGSGAAALLPLPMAACDAAQQEVLARDLLGVGSSMLMTCHTPFQSTRPNVLAGMRWLTADVQPGQCLYLSLACHTRAGGGAIVTAEGAEITSAELVEALVRPLDNTGAKLVVFNDSCHAASLLRPALRFLYGVDSVGGGLVPLHDSAGGAVGGDDAEADGRAERRAGGGSARLNCDVVMIGTADASQGARDSYASPWVAPAPRLRDARGRDGGRRRAREAAGDTAALLQRARGGGAGHQAFIHGLGTSSHRSIEASLVNGQAWLDARDIKQRMQLASSLQFDVARSLKSLAAS